MDVPNIEVNKRPQRTMSIPRRMQECELNNENEVTKQGDTVYMELIGNVEPINHHEDLMSKACKNAMKEELAAI